VVLHKPDRPVTELPAVRDLAPQVDQLLLVSNGDEEFAANGLRGVRRIAFAANRGTAAAWNAALGCARDSNCRYLYILDQDSVPAANAVVAAKQKLEREGLAAVVQPARRDILGLDPFPWNTVASGSLLDVEAVEAVGRFDESLFVDEVDHELLSRVLAAGHRVGSLPAATIGHQTGSPRRVRLLGRQAVVSGHSVERRRLQGYSAGVLVRRYASCNPSTAARLLLRHLLTAAKDAGTGQRSGASALVGGLSSGLLTVRPPAAAAVEPCPYCAGPLVGRYAAVPDWRFGAGPPADVYWCPDCGALAAGREPDPGEAAGWYAEYYTHAAEPPASRIWSRLWPTPARRTEIEAQRRYLSEPGAGGRFLEVGTGSGERLVEFAAAGWDVVGQDVDPKAGHLARSEGIPVHHCPVADIAGREAPFDLIGLNHVLEHTRRPAELVEACAGLLRPGGRICVISPNAKGLGRKLFGRWWFGLEQPRHLAIPSLDSLARLQPRLELDVEYASTSAANAAVLLGGSLARLADTTLPAGPLRRGGSFLSHLIGQAIGRAAVLVDRRLGEEVVWVVRRPGG